MHSGKFCLATTCVGNKSDTKHIRVLVLLRTISFRSKERIAVMCQGHDEPIIHCIFMS